MSPRRWPRSLPATSIASLAHRPARASSSTTSSGSTRRARAMVELVVAADAGPPFSSSPLATRRHCPAGLHARRASSSISRARRAGDGAPCDARRPRRGRRDGARRSTSGPAATRCSSARPSERSSRTGRSRGATVGWRSSAERPRLPITLRAVLGARSIRCRRTRATGSASPRSSASRSARQTVEAAARQAVGPGAARPPRRGRADRAARRAAVAVRPRPDPRRGVCGSAGEPATTAPRRGGRPIGGAPDAARRPDRSPRIAWRPATSRAPLPLLREAAESALALGAAAEAAALWRQAADLASDADPEAAARIVRER